MKYVLYQNGYLLPYPAMPFNVARDIALAQAQAGRTLVELVDSKGNTFYIVEPNYT